MKNVYNNNNIILEKKLYNLDNLEYLPEKEKLESYNKEFYKNLEDIKITDLHIEDDKKLFYHFETNINASLTSTVSQISVTSEQLVKSNIDTYKEIKQLEEEILELKKEIEIVDVQYYEFYRPEIVNLKKNMQNFLVEQKTENFKLVKEIAIIEKDKVDIQLKIYEAISKMIKLEKEVGVKPSIYNNQFDSMLLQSDTRLFFDDQ